MKQNGFERVFVCLDDIVGQSNERNQAIYREISKYISSEVLVFNDNFSVKIFISYELCQALFNIQVPQALKPKLPDFSHLRQNISHSNLLFPIKFQVEIGQLRKFTAVSAPKVLMTLGSLVKLTRSFSPVRRCFIVPSPFTDIALLVYFASSLFTSFKLYP